jgi:SP family galactose:H+ symporter-like MFS transporter
MRVRSTFVALVAPIAALGGLLFGYDTRVISGAVLFVRRDFALGTGEQEIGLRRRAAGAGCSRSPRSRRCC